MYLANSLLISLGSIGFVVLAGYFCSLIISVKEEIFKDKNSINNNHESLCIDCKKRQEEVKNYIEYLKEKNLN